MFQQSNMASARARGMVTAVQSACKHGQLVELAVSVLKQSSIMTVHMSVSSDK